ncbi:uncharacterized protein ARMOST_20776 [Armillaria ostoyae]|uniref:Uncharacterized protein n=1 Tax=Armillaria ostoyae TaxID=47428 RepID=A0A284S8D4_ARMOS|nr:uncharacterized protein ARMOST_20776 [Armillaria ostoyae]
MPVTDLEESEAKNVLLRDGTPAAQYVLEEVLINILNVDFEVLTLAEFHGLPKQGKPSTIPYVSSTGIALFIIETATRALTASEDTTEKITCYQCHALIKPNLT